MKAQITPDYPSLMELFSAQQFNNPEKDFEPSIVEPCHNLSLEEILRDYTLGIVHPERQAFYDDGEDVPETPPEVFTDFSEIILPENSSSASASTQASSTQLRESSARAGLESSASSERVNEAKSSEPKE